MILTQAERVSKETLELNQNQTRTVSVSRQQLTSQTSLCFEQCVLNNFPLLMNKELILSFSLSAPTCHYQNAEAVSHLNCLHPLLLPSLRLKFNFGPSTSGWVYPMPAPLPCYRWSLGVLCNIAQLCWMQL